MKATIDFDETLYRRLKIEAAKRGRTVRDLVAEGVHYVLDGAPSETDSADSESAEQSRPEWFGILRNYGQQVEDHSMEAVRWSIVNGRSGSVGEP